MSTWLDGSRSQAGPVDRQQDLDELTGHVRRFAAEGPFWPGNDLVAVPREPRVMPDKPSGAAEAKGGAAVWAWPE